MKPQTLHLSSLLFSSLLTSTMARPKFENKSLFEHPLAASSSSSEDEEVEEEEEQKGSAVKKPKSYSKTPHSPSPSPSDDDEEEEEKEEDASSEESDSKQATPPKKKLFVSKPKLNDPKTPSSSDDDDDEEEDDDDEPPLPKVNSIASSKPKKTVSSVTPLNSSSKAKKRPFESEKDSKKKKKKKKQKKVDEEEVEEDEEVSLMNTTPFQRIWSDEDEIFILKGMIESKKNGVDPLSDVKEFLESIKKSLTVKEVRQEQLKNKIKRLRRKFMNSSKRAKGDEDPVFSKPHELLSYTLMKEIWGGRNSVVVASGGKDDNDDSVVVADGRRSSSRTRKSKNAAVSPVRIKMTTLSDDISLELDGSNGYLHPCVHEWIYPRNDMNMVGGSFFKEGLDLIGDSKKKDFEQKWRSLSIDELKVYLRRIQLVREQTIAILDAYKSSDASEHE